MSESRTAVEIGRLAELVFRKLTVEMEASGRHVHLTREAVEALFGPGHRLTPVRDLSQPGQFVCAERVTVEGPKGSLPNVVVLGPERQECQAEISLTDGVALGVKPPVKLSGDTEQTPGVTLRNGEQIWRMDRGLLAAKRHIHITPEDAALFGVEHGQAVRFQTFTARPVIFGDVEVRVSDKFATIVHLDYDEANACGYKKGDRGMIVK